jgi:AcrR family transcriptional regulator
VDARRVNDAPASRPRVGRGRPSTDDDRRLEEGRRTTAELIRIARALFTEHGYAATATTQIVDAAQLTRGALYHHFADKRALFAAVFDQVYQEIGAAVESAAPASLTPWERLVAGCDAFVVAGSDPTRVRIAFVDGPAVLGWEEWKAADRTHTESGLEALLGALTARGELPAVSVPALTRLLSGGMNEAVLWVARAPDRRGALSASQSALRALIEGLRMRGHS